MRLLAGLLILVSGFANATQPDPKYVPAFLDAKKDFEKGVVPTESVLLATWKCLNYHPIKEAAPPSEIRFMKQEGELRMTLTSTDSEGEISFENYGPFTSGTQAWNGTLQEDVGLRAAIKMDPLRKHLVIETMADQRAKDMDGFQTEFKAVSDPKSWVMVYSICDLGPP